MRDKNRDGRYKNFDGGGFSDTQGNHARYVGCDGIGEFVQCHECGYMHSKKDIYGNLPAQQYNFTVKKIMGDFEIDDIPCQKCSGKTYFVYGKNNIEAIKERYQKTVASFLVIVRDAVTDEIVGYEDAYIDTLDSIFQRELFTHYKDIGVEEIRNRIHKIMGYSPDFFLELADMGLLGNYRNIKNLSHILYKFAHAIPREFDEYVGFCEVDRANVMKQISIAVGGISLAIQDDFIFNKQISNTSPHYISDLVLYNRAGLLYKNNFHGSAKELIGLIRRNYRASFI